MPRPMTTLGCRIVRDLHSLK